MRRLPDASKTVKGADAGSAIAMILGGDVEGGLEAYRTALTIEAVPTVPIGAHLELLRAAGLDEARERITEIALRRGGNIALRASSLGIDAAGAAAEYEALFARGVANARMAHDYCLVLARLGQIDKLRAMLDPRLLLCRVELDKALAADVQHMLLNREMEAEERVAFQSVRNMRVLTGLHTLADPAAIGLIEAISRESHIYLNNWAASEHPLAKVVPTSVDIQAWGLISRGDGHTVPHIHAQGWATGVFYPAPPERNGGELIIGRLEDAAGSDADWHTTRVRPDTGLLVLIPSFYTHWTAPLDGPGLRTSVAFDVVPQN